MGSDDDTTELYDVAPVRHAPVPTASALPAAAPPNARCWVEDEQIHYIFYDGQWRRLGPPPRR